VNARLLTVGRASSSRSTSYRLGQLRTNLLLDRLLVRHDFTSCGQYVRRWTFPMMVTLPPPLLGESICQRRTISALAHEVSRHASGSPRRLSLAIHTKAVHWSFLNNLQAHVPTWFQLNGVVSTADVARPVSPRASIPCDLAGPIEYHGPSHA